MKYRLKCVTCGKAYEAEQHLMTCPACGEFKGTLDVLYNYEKLRDSYRYGLSGLRHQSIVESFLPILPFANPGSLPAVPVGETPLFKSPALAGISGLDNLWIKDDGRNPSASLKDRASAVAIAMARESSSTTIAAASTGNAASSLATLAASSGLEAVLFVPKTIPRPKLAQLLVHDARVICLDCDYDTAFELCQKACGIFGWYNRNTAVNPFTGEGKKTAALEIARDLETAPDAVICPVGDGCIISALYKGFEDLRKLGLVERIPRLYGVQASGANPVVRAYTDNEEIKPMSNVKTIADSISVGYPRDGVKALRAVRNSNGTMIAVGDDEILEARKLLASKAGIFSEPAASAAMAGALKIAAAGLVDREETVVLLLTGHGLKDVESVMNNTDAKLEIIKPDLDSIAHILEKQDATKYKGV